MQVYCLKRKPSMVVGTQGDTREVVGRSVPGKIQRFFFGWHATIQFALQLQLIFVCLFEGIKTQKSLLRCSPWNACREISSSAKTAEKRDVNASGLLLHILFCAGLQPRLLSTICIQFA